MKKFVLLPLSAIMFFSNARANMFIVQVSNFQFSVPNIPNVIVGDTIRWIWVSGVHTTTNNPATQPGTSLPAGAATWDVPMTATSTSFDYKVTVAGVYNYYCTPHKTFMIATFTASAALPVKLTAFAVNASNGKAVINWKTATEQNTDYFSVRRSLNGSTYTEIAKVPAAGNSASEQSYSFADAGISNNQYYYYNIAMVDKDGKQEFSETKLFKGEGKMNKLVLSLSPNPIIGPGHLMLSFNAVKEGKMEVTLINAQGQTIVKTQMQAYQGVNSGHVHLGTLPAGNYTLTCILDGIRESHKIIFK